MATGNVAGQQPRQAQQTNGLLGTLALSAEHMFAIGCLTLLIVLAACGIGGWWLVSSWTTPADPDQIVTQVRRGEIEHSSLDECPAGRTKFYTQNGMVCR